MDLKSLNKLGFHTMKVFSHFLASSFYPIIIKFIPFSVPFNEYLQDNFFTVTLILAVIVNFCFVIMGLTLMWSLEWSVTIRNFLRGRFWNHPQSRQSSCHHHGNFGGCYHYWDWGHRLRQRNYMPHWLGEFYIFGIVPY